MKNYVATSFLQPNRYLTARSATRFWLKIGGPTNSAALV
jgi:hypothetical protein